MIKKLAILSSLMENLPNTILLDLDLQRDTPKSQCRVCICMIQTCEHFNIFFNL